LEVGERDNRKRKGEEEKKKRRRRRWRWSIKRLLSMRSIRFLPKIHEKLASKVTK
jgi:hypothetical protein